jgi:hypothetical protein
MTSRTLVNDTDTHQVVNLESPIIKMRFTTIVLTTAALAGTALSNPSPQSNNPGSSICLTFYTDVNCTGTSETGTVAADTCLTPTDLSTFRSISIDSVEGTPEDFKVWTTRGCTCKGATTDCGTRTWSVSSLPVGTCIKDFGFRPQYPFGGSVELA